MRVLHVAFLICLLFSLSFANPSKADDKKKNKKPKMKVINISLLSVSQKINEIRADENFYVINSQSVSEWLPLMKKVREGNISRQNAVDSMNKLTNSLWDYMELCVKRKKTVKYSDEEWVFPVKGYDANAIGGSGGSGYITSGFDFFEINSGGHPAQDIFIADKNQDCIDDVTGNEVEILSMSGGVVVETRKNWDNTMMDIRGGNIVYVYDNYTNGLFFYAHMKDVKVNVGDFVKPGTVLGTLGRTGKNAYPSRSPTHLHIMYVRSHNGEMIPENLYKDLLKAKTVN